MNTEAALLIKQNTIKENKQRLKVLLVFKGLYSAMLCTYFWMVFPLNYELGEWEENNLSVKFKLLIRQICLRLNFLVWGKKLLLDNTLEDHKSVHAHSPWSHQLEHCSSCGYSPGYCGMCDPRAWAGLAAGEPEAQLCWLKCVCSQQPHLWLLGFRDRTIKTEIRFLQLRSGLIL